MGQNIQNWIRKRAVQIVGKFQKAGLHLKIVIHISETQFAQYANNTCYKHYLSINEQGICVKKRSGI